MRRFQANEMIVIQSPRLQLSQFQITDAEEVFACITPSITRFMRWDPHPGANTSHDAKNDCGLRSQIHFPLSSDGATARNALAWPRWKSATRNRRNWASG